MLQFIIHRNRLVYAARCQYKLDTQKAVVSSHHQSVSLCAFQGVGKTLSTAATKTGGKNLQRFCFELHVD